MNADVNTIFILIPTPLPELRSSPGIAVPLPLPLRLARGLQTLRLPNATIGSSMDQRALDPNRCPATWLDSRRTTRPIDSGAPAADHKDVTQRRAPNLAGEYLDDFTGEYLGEYLGEYPGEFLDENLAKNE